MHDRLCSWFDTFDSDPFTVAVVGALVDCAETLWQADGMLGEPLGSEATQALADLDEALRDTEVEA